MNQLSDSGVAKVVCRMLGHSGGVAVFTNQESLFGKFSARPILLTNVQCTGKEKSIFDCPRQVDKPETGQACGHDTDLGITCS